MPNFVTLCFKPCEPAPANGYRVDYRPSGSAEPLRTWPANFFPSAPELVAGIARATLLEDADPDGTQYEGYVYGDCAAGLGVGVPWTTGDNPSESSSASVSASASASASASHGVGLTGDIHTDACFTEAAITEVRWQGFDVLEVAGAFPVNAGQTVTAAVPAPGSHTLRVNVTLTNPGTGRVVVTDSLGNVQCADVTGVDDVSFPAFVISEGLPWSVTMDCGACE